MERRATHFIGVIRKAEVAITEGKRGFKKKREGKDMSPCSLARGPMASALL